MFLLVFKYDDFDHIPQEIFICTGVNPSYDRPSSS